MVVMEQMMMNDGFDYFVDVSQMELGEHSILVQLLDEKDKVISEKDLKINII